MEGVTCLALFVVLLLVLLRCAVSFHLCQGALLACLAYCSPGLPYVFSRTTALLLSLLQVLLEGVRCIILSLLNFMRFLLARISAYWLHPQLIIIRRHFVPSSNHWLVLVCDWCVSCYCFSWNICISFWVDCFPLRHVNEKKVELHPLLQVRGCFIDMMYAFGSACWNQY